MGDNAIELEYDTIYDDVLAQDSSNNANSNKLDKMDQNVKKRITEVIYDNNFQKYYDDYNEIELEHDITHDGLIAQDSSNNTNSNQFDKMNRNLKNTVTEVMHNNDFQDKTLDSNQVKHKITLI